MGKTKTYEFGSLYEFNRERMKNFPQMNTQDFIFKINNIASWFSTNQDFKYFLFYNKEKSDFTFFDIETTNYNKAREELTNLILSRGKPISVDFNHDNEYFEIWVKQKGEVYMYILFNCNDFVITVQEKNLCNI